MIDKIINSFLALLRQQGVRVSPAESIDALQALNVMGLSQRAVVRDTLRATLVKNTEDIPIFDRLFDLYFGLHPVVAKPSGSFRIAEHDHDHGDSLSRVELGEDL